MDREMVDLRNGMVVVAPEWLMQATHYIDILVDDPTEEELQGLVCLCKRTDKNANIDDLKAFVKYLKPFCVEYDFSEYCIVERFSNDNDTKAVYFKPMSSTADYYDLWKGSHCVPYLEWICKESAFWFVSKK